MYTPCCETSLPPKHPNTVYLLLRRQDAASLVFTMLQFNLFQFLFTAGINIQRIFLEHTEKPNGIVLFKCFHNLKSVKIHENFV